MSQLNNVTPPWPSLSLAVMSQLVPGLPPPGPSNPQHHSTYTPPYPHPITDPCKPLTPTTLANHTTCMCWSGRTSTSERDPEPTWVARHPLKLRSAYSEVTGSEPPYTTCHSKFLGTVDYMWYTPQVSLTLSLVSLRSNILDRYPLFISVLLGSINFVCVYFCKSKRSNNQYQNHQC